jgi:phage tail sheath protein FI
MWASVAGRVTAILEQLRTLGAFEARGPDEPYVVRCDRTTMSAADIDAGRVRCEIIINPASPIERIVVTLSLIEPVPALTQEAA